MLGMGSGLVFVLCARGGEVAAKGPELKDRDYEGRLGGIGGRA